jgi:hypothetical protein
MLRVAANQSPGTLLQRVFRPSFANTRNSGIGFNGDHAVTLIEERCRIRRLIYPNARDLHLWQGGLRESAGGNDNRAGTAMAKKISSFHFKTIPRVTRANDKSKTINADLRKDMIFNKALILSRCGFDV